MLCPAVAVRSSNPTIKERLQPGRTMPNDLVDLDTRLQKATSSVCVFEGRMLTEGSGLLQAHCFATFAAAGGFPGVGRDTFDGEPHAAIA